MTLRAGVCGCSASWAGRYEKGGGEGRIEAMGGCLLWLIWSMGVVEVT